MKNLKYCFLLAVCFFICGCEGTDQDKILPLTLEVIDNSNPDNVKIVQNSKAPSNCLDVYAGNDESTLIIQASYSFNIYDDNGNTSHKEYNSYHQYDTWEFDAGWYILKKDNLKIEIRFLKSEDNSPEDVIYYLSGFYTTMAKIRIHRNTVAS